MLRICLISFAVVVCGSVLSADGAGVPSLISTRGRESVAESEPTTQEADAEVTEATEQPAERKICFRLLGCFSMEKPWRSTLRPIPAPFAPEKIPVRMLFYTQPNTDEEYVIETYPSIELGDAPFDPTKPIVVITHGFSNNGSAQWLHDLKDAYLGKVDANVMITDWGAGAQHWNYLQVTANTRVVARLVADFLKYLIENKGADVKKIHLIGHSLGAQISSYIAKQVPGIGRLTALDPAQPGFEGFDKAVRLDKSDADFVDVIHTDAKPFIPALGFGMLAPHGHVDFYMNGGFEQPGCILPSNLNLTVNGLTDLAKFSVDYFSEIKTCNHGRAHQYLIEAFNETENCIFWGHKASASNVAKALTHTVTQGFLSDLVALSSSCTKEDCVPVGFGTRQSPLRGTFIVTTSNKPPYCIPEPGVSPESSDENGEQEPITTLGGAAAFAKQSIGRFGKGIKNLISFGRMY